MTLAEIHAHLTAGHEVALVTYTQCRVMSGAKFVSYIRQDKDGKGFRLGWPGKGSVYCFANQLRLVPAGHTMLRQA